MLPFAETCKLRVIDNDETFAIDEYFFSFFNNNGKEAINLLKILVEGAGGRDREVPAIAGPSSASPHSLKSPDSLRIGMGHEMIKSTLAPQSHSASGRSSPRASGELSRASFDAFKALKQRRSADVARVRDPSSRSSFIHARRSQSQTRRAEDAVQEKQASSESYVQSMDDPSMSAQVLSSSEEPSASQILKGSDVFRSPTMRRSISSSGLGKGRDGSVSSARDHSPSPAMPSGSHHHAASTGHLEERPTSSRKSRDQQPPTPTLQNITKMGTYPLQRAGAFAAYLNSTGRKMSSLLASESMGYVEKVSGMWKGGRKHYEQPAGLKTDDDDDGEEGGKHADANERFRAHFMLPEAERLQSTYFGHLFRVLPLYGKIYISDKHFCFRSLLPGTRTKLILPLKDIENVDKAKGLTFGYAALVLVVRGHEELFFEFNKVDLRDDCTVTLLRSLEATRYLKGSEIRQDQEERELEECARQERDALKEERSKNMASQTVLPDWNDGRGPTILLEDPKASILEFKPKEALNITCLTIGSRGDVQPYISFCKGLLAEGHKPTIATHAEFKSWIEGHGIRFQEVAGDPAELMRLCIENGTFTLAFLAKANAMFRGWLDDLLASSWSACQGADVLIESPSAMAGIHIAEALGIPYFRAFTMPWTRTRAYPHAFIMPETKRGGSYNFSTYVLFENVFWRAMAGQVNRWRHNTLSLPSTSLEKMQVNKIPFLYNFSPLVVPPPIDYSDWVRVTGYWFLDEGGNYTPPPELAAFIAKARADGKKLVYVGFGSIIVSDPAKMTQDVIEAVQAAGVRCILSKGWSDRDQQKKTEAQEEPKMPPEIFVIKSCPHDWLFQQMDAAAHHGGSGTTGASLRAGIPTIIRPFFGDQFFFGSRVEDLGVGIWLKKWGARAFGRALWNATHNQRIVDRARILGERIRGVSLLLSSSPSSSSSLTLALGRAKLF
jgi:sterol 3beta-glucosyltransferase